MRGHVPQAKALKENGEEFVHKLFDEQGDEWVYKHANLKPWRPDTEVREFEYDGVISSVTKQFGACDRLVPAAVHAPQTSSCRWRRRALASPARRPTGWPPRSRKSGRRRRPASGRRLCPARSYFGADSSAAARARQRRSQACLLRTRAGCLTRIAAVPSPLTHVQQAIDAPSSKEVGELVCRTAVPGHASAAQREQVSALEFAVKTLDDHNQQLTQELHQIKWKVGRRMHWLR